MSSRIQKARLIFANLSYLWRRPDIRLSTEGRVYTVAPKSIWFYGCETWPFWAEDIQRHSVLEHRCLCGIGRIWSMKCVRNSEVGLKLLRPRVHTSNKQTLHQHWLRWLEHLCARIQNICLVICWSLRQSSWPVDDMIKKYESFNQWTGSCGYSHTTDGWTIGDTTQCYSKCFCSLTD